MLLTQEYNKLIIVGALDHPVNGTDLSKMEQFNTFGYFPLITYLLLVINDLAALLLEEVLQTFPAQTAITRPVNGSIGRMHKNRLIVEAAPHKIMDLTVQVECLEIDLGCHALVLVMTFLLLGVLVGVSAHTGHHRSRKQTCDTERGQQSDRLHPSQKIYFDSLGSETLLLIA